MKKNNFFLYTIPFFLFSAMFVTASSSLASGKTLSAQCSNFITVLKDAGPGDVVNLSDSQPCGEFFIRNLKVAAPGVTINIPTSQQLILILWDSSGLHFNGGTFYNNRPGDTTNYGVAIRRSKDFSFTGSTFTNALRGMVIGDKTSDFYIKNSTFKGLGSDGINLSDNVDRFVISGNVMSDFKPTPTSCTLPNATIEYELSRVACEAKSGVWKDGDHADGIQMWNTVRDGLIQNNNISGKLQGISTFGPPGPSYHERLWLINNTVSLENNQGIKIETSYGFARGNLVTGVTTDQKNKVQFDVYGEGTITCENTATGKGILVGTGNTHAKNCSQVATPTAPTPPLGIPPTPSPITTTPPPTDPRELVFLPLIPVPPTENPIKDLVVAEKPIQPVKVTEALNKLKPIDFSKTLAPGAKGEHVTGLQMFLQRLGYYNYPEFTTFYGGVTTQAVKNYQNANSLEQVGAVGPKTRALIESNKDAVVENSVPVSLQTQPAVTVLSPVLDTNSLSDVISLQRFLNQNGFTVTQTGPGSKGRENGVFGPATQNALKRFQGFYSLPVTGRYDSQTREKVRELR